ncbi:MAG: branched-chain amino acid aminotransferase [Acholeplasmataceae bacterium]|nr:branched-chain amino acid aminotransferase [Acholeplasmataceae bacterium]
MMRERPKGFKYVKTSFNYISYYKDGAWDEGVLRKEDTLTISATSTSIHYGQQCFEGLKAYRRKDGQIQLFRIEDNANRFKLSCERLAMPIISTEKFIDAVKKTVKANEDFVPDYGYGETLYIRPFMIGVGNNLGLRPSSEYIFSVIVSPVGPYFSGIAKPVDMMVSPYDRAAPHGTGDVKVGGNYAASLKAQLEAKKLGFADCIFLDPKTHSKIEEVGVANFFGITKDKKYITPKSPSILNSITNRSLKWLAMHVLDLQVLEEDIFIDELDQFEEAGACGTAAVISPIGSITNIGKKHVFPYHDTMGPYTKQLYDLLTGIQFGDIKDPNHWVTVLE